MLLCTSSLETEQGVSHDRRRRLSFVQRLGRKMKAYLQAKFLDFPPDGLCPVEVASTDADVRRHEYGAQCLPQSALEVQYETLYPRSDRQRCNDSTQNLLIIFLASSNICGLFRVFLSELTTSCRRSFQLTATIERFHTQSVTLIQSHIEKKHYLIIIRQLIRRHNMSVKSLTVQLTSFFCNLGCTAHVCTTVLVVKWLYVINCSPLYTVYILQSQVCRYPQFLLSSCGRNISVKMISPFISGSFRLNLLSFS